MCPELTAPLPNSSWYRLQQPQDLKGQEKWMDGNVSAK